MITDIREDEVTIQLRGQDYERALPSTILPAFRFARVLRPPNILHWTVVVDGHAIRQPVAISETFTREVADEQMFLEIYDYIEDLAIVQDVLRQPFAVPPIVTTENAQTAHRLREILEGKSVPWMPGPGMPVRMGRGSLAFGIVILLILAVVIVTSVKRN